MAQRLIDEVLEALNEKTGSARRPPAASQHPGTR